MVGPWPPPLEEECAEEEEEKEPPRCARLCAPRPECIRRKSIFGKLGETKCVPCLPKKPPDLDFRVFPRFGATRPKVSTKRSWDSPFEYFKSGIFPWPNQTEQATRNGLLPTGRPLYCVMFLSVLHLLSVLHHLSLRMFLPPK